MMAMSETLIVNEIYRTIQGEGARAGRPCTIVRLTGCNLRCSWCDTTYAYEQGAEMPIEDVLAEVAPHGAGLVLVTGGEPLAQAGSCELVRRLCDTGRPVQVETNGSMDVSALDDRAVRCVDVKCPGSGEGGSFLKANLPRLRPGDELKFTLAGRGDYDFAREFLGHYDVPAGVEVVFTPVAGRMAPRELAEWILADGLDVRLGLQLHKIIWPDAQRGV